MEMESKTPETTRAFRELGLYELWIPMPMATPTGVVIVKMKAIRA